MRRGVTLVEDKQPRCVLRGLPGGECVRSGRPAALLRSLRSLRRLRSPLPWLHQRDCGAEAQAVVPVRRPAPGTACCPATLAEIAPTATPDHPARAMLRTRGVGWRALFVIIGV